MIDFDSQPRIIADIVMLRASEGGRNHAIEIDANTRYMPHLAIDDRANRAAQIESNKLSTEHYMGVLFEPPLSRDDPATGSGRYPLRLMYYPSVDYAALRTGATFTVREGGHIVGHGIVISSELETDLKQPR